MTGRTTVDVLSLEDFHKRLAGRLTEAEAVLKKLNTEMQCRPPELGTFADATSNARRYSDLHLSYAQQVERLRDAVRAAQSATGTILTNYKTTEARNAANSADIAAALGGVDDALGRQEDPRV
ncbi:hypothetical protein C5N14_14380 [Micromonospora sp. MW-13]|uniref:hypothetical protein n=1 Tax=unclassified Micromonospora TaxID=2617518 RepID=UPI000E44B395|nr:MULTISPECIES: hypothetical protein [unclassified Micromonospora]MCX4474666.1 hypothetical protein [Micromonospora sp. NBC_01655]RGC68277.1 hypothetical protein C5N14_14380 [Micromonospora sp. MW-13]